MDLQELAAYARSAEFHRSVVGGYKGFYNLTLFRSPDPAEGEEDRFAIRLQVEEHVMSEFPKSVKVNGETMSVFIQRAGRLPSC